MSDDLRNTLSGMGDLRAELEAISPGVTKSPLQREVEQLRAQAPAPATLDAMDRLLNRLVGMFGDDANAMPDQMLDDYLTARAWLDEQPVRKRGWADASGSFSKTDWRHLVNQQEAENFIRVWQTSSSRMEVMERLGLSGRQIDGRSYRLRKQGIVLKAYNGTQGPLDIDGLKKLAESLLDD